ncbi:MAG: hypothetical protein HY917_00745 [Candidatus Diapherotrites archaeon]|nr:hypothetical protein [Candidatus Diapherotrites archaeon]
MPPAKPSGKISAIHKKFPYRIPRSELPGEPEIDSRRTKRFGLNILEKIVTPQLGRVVPSFHFQNATPTAVRPVVDYAIAHGLDRIIVRSDLQYSPDSVLSNDEWARAPRSIFFGGPTGSAGTGGGNFPVYATPAGDLSGP